MKGNEKFSLINDELELNIDDITTEQLSAFPRIIKLLKLNRIKIWKTSYEIGELSKLGIRKNRGRKDVKLNSESPAIISKLFNGISDNIEKSSKIIELGLFGMNLSIKAWTKLGKSLETSKITSLFLQKCGISEKELEVLFQSIGSMLKIQILDLSDNNLRDNCGYLLGRIISKQGERRDTIKWEEGLRGCIADIPDGLIELYIKNNQIGDYGWEKIMSSLVSDNWLRLIDAKKNGITSSSFIATSDALDHNKTILVMDLRENPEFITSNIKILEIIESNFDYINRESFENEKYSQLFEYIRNEEPLPKTYEIKVFSNFAKKASTRSSSRSFSTSNVDKKNMASYISKISQEVEMLREENEQLRKKLGKSTRKSHHKLENTQDYIVLAEKTLKEADQVLELVDDF